MKPHVSGDNDWRTLAVKILGKIKSMWTDQSGTTMVEYGLLVALLGATAMFAAARFGLVNADMFKIVADTLSGVS